MAGGDSITSNTGAYCLIMFQASRTYMHTYILQHTCMDACICAYIQTRTYAGIIHTHEDSSILIRAYLLTYI